MLLLYFELLLFAYTELLTQLDKKQDWAVR